MAPSTDSSASRLWGGTAGRRPAGAGGERRGRVSSKAWTMVPQPSPIGPVERKGIFLGIRAAPVDEPWTSSRCGQAGARSHHGDAWTGASARHDGPAGWTATGAPVAAGARRRRRGAGRASGSAPRRRPPRSARRPRRRPARPARVLPTVLMGSSSSEVACGRLTAPVCSSTPRRCRPAPTEPNSRLAGGPGRDGDHGADQGRATVSERLAVPGVPQVARPAHGGGLRLDPVGGQRWPCPPGSRWLRAKPPATSMMSPRLPTPSMSVRSRTFMHASPGLDDVDSARPSASPRPRPRRPPRRSRSRGVVGRRVGWRSRRASSPTRPLGPRSATVAAAWPPRSPPRPPGRSVAVRWV